MIREEEVFKIGQFAKPHGIKGELSLVTNSDVLEDAEDPYIVCEMDGILVPFFVEDFRYKTDTVVLVKLEDVNSEEDARMFVGKEVFYPLDAVDEEDLGGGYDVGQFYRLYRDGRTERLFRRDNRRG